MRLDLFKLAFEIESQIEIGSYDLGAKRSDACNIARNDLEESQFRLRALEI